ncbi:MAG: LacI family DNA-binding transcriptional regulator [Lentisphaeria bacterium]
MMTQKEIAKILNISRSTVSLALAKSPKVKQKTLKRVSEFAQKINYHPDMAARSLVLKKTNLIGVLLPSFAHRFLSELSDEIFHCLNQRGYSVLFGVSNGEEELSNLIGSMMARKVDGIISYFGNLEKLVKLNENGLPIVVYRRVHHYPLSYVDVDRFKGSMLLASHLIETGHKRIAFVGGIDKTKIFDRRFAGYQEAMFENDFEIDPSLIVDISGEMKEGIKGMQILLEKSKGNLPDAVMFHNDSMALGGMSEAQRNGIKIPDDMAIVGFDNIEESRYSLPALTTVKQPKKLIAEKLVEILVSQIEDKGNHFIAENYIFMPEIIVRESSKSSSKKNV